MIIFLLIGFFTIIFSFTFFQAYKLAKQKEIMQKKIETLLFENGKYGSKVESLNEIISDVNHENKNLKTSKQMMGEKLTEVT